MVLGLSFSLLEEVSLILMLGMRVEGASGDLVPRQQRRFGSGSVGEDIYSKTVGTRGKWL